MSSTQIALLGRLKTSLITFIDNLMETLPEYSEKFLIFRIFLENQCPIVDIMNYIVVKLLPLQEMVKERNEKFFLEHNILFEQMDSDDRQTVNHFKNIWLSDLDQHNKDIIWKWFDSFLLIANKYVAVK